MSVSAARSREFTVEKYGERLVEALGHLDERVVMSRTPVL
jgi:hypothetical protein